MKRRRHKFKEIWNRVVSATNLDELSPPAARVADIRGVQTRAIIHRVAPVMPTKHCAYGTCTNDSRYFGRSHMDGVFFIAFPKPTKELEKCRRWVAACGRKHFSEKNVRKGVYICSVHFVGGQGPTTAYPDPIPATARSYTERTSFLQRKARQPPRARTEQLPGPVLRDASESVFLDNEIPTGSYVECTSDSTWSTDCITVDLSSTEQNTVNNPTSSEPKSTGSSANMVFSDVFDHGYSLTRFVTVGRQPKMPCLTSDAAVQTNLEFEDLKPYPDVCFKEKGKLKRHIFCETALQDDKSSKFYFGLTVSTLHLLFGWLQNKASRMSYWKGPSSVTEENRTRVRNRSRGLALFEEFMLVMVRLRRGVDCQFTADLFGVSKSHVSRVFSTWINLMYFELKFLIRWPTKEQVKQRLPRGFKYFPKTRAVIDCTEFFVQRPTLPSSQRVTYSSYKHRSKTNTFKALVATTPNGSFSFISRLWAGSTSDRKMVVSSGFLDYLEYDDDIMADRGFLIRDLLAVRNATLNIPPFTINGRLSSRAATKTRRIASARIHVERAIGRLKSFGILQGILPLKLKPLSDQIMLICACLCNLEKELAK